MSLVRRVAPVVLAAAAVVAVVLVVERAGADRRPGPATAIRATSSLSDRTVLFGTPVVARLAVLVDPARVDPAGVRVDADFSPFRVAGAPTVGRVRRGGVTILRYAYRLECLDAACAPRAPQRGFAFRPALVRYGGGEGRVSWPSLTVASRLSPNDLARKSLRLPAATRESYRVSPQVVGWSLAALAGLLLLGAGLMAARLLAPRGRHPLLAVSPLERALALVGQATSRAADERRTALDRLALALDETGAERLATASRKLAWSEPEPEGGAMRELVAAVRRRDSEGFR